jgi:hypothetical protein
MSEAPEPAAAAAIYTSIQPAGGPYKANSIKEGFICAGIWAALSHRSGCFTNFVG